MRNVAKKGLLTAVATGSVLASTAGYAYACADTQDGAANSPGAMTGNSLQVPMDVPVNACGNTVDAVGMLNPSSGNRCDNGGSGAPGPAAPGHAASGQSAPEHTGSGQSAPEHTGSGQSAPADGAHGGGAAKDSGPGIPGASVPIAPVFDTTAGSPDVASGNNAQVPMHIPVNACGNTFDVTGLGDPAFGSACDHEAVTKAPTTDEDCPPEGPGPSTPPTPPKEPVTPTPAPETPAPPHAGVPADTVPVVAVTPATPVVPAQPTGKQLASTGAGGIEMLGAAGLAALLGGGVLYRRSRAGAR